MVPTPRGARTRPAGQHRIVHQRLEIWRQHRQSSQQHDADDKDQHNSGHEIPVAEQRGIDERIARRHRVDREQIETEHAEHGFEPDFGRAEPVKPLAAVEEQLQRPNAETERRKSEPVEPSGHWPVGAPAEEQQDAEDT
jgi:hypothetical protein